MKRYLHIMFVCACALFVFVANVAAQLSNGAFVTISNGTYYLAVNGDNIARVQNNNPTINCLWKVVKEGDNYSFESVSSVGKYLYVYKDISWQVIPQI